MIIDLPVGTIVKSQEKRGVVEAGSGCSGCMFSENENDESCNKIACSWVDRKDSQSVIVKEIKDESTGVQER